MVAAAGALFFAGRLHGQESLRMSLAGDLAAQRQRQAASSIGYYNLLTGPVAWRFSTGLGVRYDDNIHQQSQNQQSDFIFRPNLNTQMHWPVTLRNSLDVSIGAGYSLYATHSELDQFYMSPGSGLSFDIYAGNFVINVHDWISVTENNYQNPTARSTGNFARLENAVGTSALWDMNKVVSQAGYDHVNDISLGSTQTTPDATSDSWFLNAGVRVIPEVMAGVEGGFGLINYDQGQTASPQPNASQWNAGVFCKAQATEYINARLDVGYTVYSPEATAGYPNLSSSASMYFQLLISHRVNQFLNYGLSAGRSTQSTFYGQAYDYYFVQFQPNWSILNNYSLTTPFWWKRGTQLYTQSGAASYDYDQYGAGINISHPITKKLSGTLGYQLVKETSGQSSLNYTVNIVSLNFSYQF